MIERKSLTESEVTEKLIEFIYTVVDGWFSPSDVSRMGYAEWNELFDRVDGIVLEDGTEVDLGTDLVSPGVKKIKSLVRDYRRQM